MSFLEAPLIYGDGDSHAPVVLVVSAVDLTPLVVCQVR